MALWRDSVVYNCICILSKEIYVPYVLCCVSVWLGNDWLYPYPSWGLHCHRGNTTTPNGQWSNPKEGWIDHMNPLWMDNVTTANQNTAKPCAYVLDVMGYRVNQTTTIDTMNYLDITPQTVMQGGIPPSIQHDGARNVANHGMTVSSLRLIFYCLNLVQWLALQVICNTWSMESWNAPESEISKSYFSSGCWADSGRNAGWNFRDGAWDAGWK